MSSLDSIHCVCINSGTILPVPVVNLVNTTTLTDYEVSIYNIGGEGYTIDVAVEKGTDLSNFIKYNNLVKLKYIFSALDQVNDGNIDKHMVMNSLQKLKELIDPYQQLYCQTSKE